MRPAAGSEPWEPGFLLRSPVLESLRAAAAPLADLPAWPGHDEINTLPPGPAGWPRNTRGLPIRFVPPPGPGQAQPPYENEIAVSGRVPTRGGNWHDLFNALVWISFPRSKAALNARHCAAREARAEASRRSPVEDALAGFDESGVAVACSDAELEALLRGFRWRELFCAHRARVGAGMGFFLFGHGLSEAALRPYIGITGKAIIVPVPGSFTSHSPAAQLDRLDLALAAVIADPGRLLAPRELAPLPLLGVPGWWAANEAEDFYGNRDYFRPGRRQRRA